MRCIAYDKERLERGQSTENVSAIISLIKELKEKRRAQNEEDTRNL
jgi:hypothetical protein